MQICISIRAHGEACCAVALLPAENNNCQSVSYLHETLKCLACHLLLLVRSARHVWSDLLSSVWLTQRAEFVTHREEETEGKKVQEIIFWHTCLCANTPSMLDRKSLGRIQISARQRFCSSCALARSASRFVIGAFCSSPSTRVEKMSRAVSRLTSQVLAWSTVN